MAEYIWQRDPGLEIAQFTREQYDLPEGQPFSLVKAVSWIFTRDGLSCYGALHPGADGVVEDGVLSLSLLWHNEEKPVAELEFFRVAGDVQSGMEVKVSGEYADFEELVLALERMNLPSWPEKLREEWYNTLPA